ncbi:MAG TPA: diguanylate cyclase [Polyangia bacterium]|nr:diguanylate cyclase [Polyangia bacterium]
MTTRRKGTNTAPLFLQPVLIVEPSAVNRSKAAAIAGELGYAARSAADAFEAHALIDGAGAVIAAHPASVDLYPRLRAAGLPFIAAFGPKQPQSAQVAQQLGADAFLSKPYRRETVSLALFAAAGARLLRDRALRAELALADVSGVKRQEEKSGLLHIDLFKTLLPLEIRRARRHGYPIAICVVSLDPLPAQHQISPEVAAACEPLLRAAVRDVDLAVRYGDGRFLVFLPHTDGRGAEAVGRRIVAAIRDCRFRSGGVTRMVTASVGIATPREGKAPSFARLIRDAHAAVKAAQLKGGDRAIIR